MNNARLLEFYLYTKWWNIHERQNENLKRFSEKIKFFRSFIEILRAEKTSGKLFVDFSVISQNLPIHFQKITQFVKSHDFHAELENAFLIFFLVTGIDFNFSAKMSKLEKIYFLKKKVYKDYSNLLQIFSRKTELLCNSKVTFNCFFKFDFLMLPKKWGYNCPILHENCEIWQIGKIVFNVSSSNLPHIHLQLSINPTTSNQMLVFNLV